MKETLKKIVSDFIELLNKNSTKIRNIVIITLLFVLVLLVVINKISSNRYLKSEGIIERIKWEKDLLLQRNSILSDSLIKESQLRYDLESIKSSLLITRDSLIDQNKNLKWKLSQVSDEIDNITPDSSYVFLTTIAYPFDGDKEYIFNEKQVSSIHETFIVNIEINKLVDNLESQLIICDETNIMNKKLTDSYKESYEIVLTQNDNLNEIIEINEEQSNILEKQLKQTKFGNTVWKGVSGVLAILAIAIII